MPSTLTGNFTLKDTNMRFEESLVDALAENLGMDAGELRPKVKSALKKTVEKLVQEPVIYGWVCSVAKAYGLDAIQLYAETRRQPIAEARQVAMYLAATEGRVQHIAIANHFGCVKQNVDYTVQKISGAISCDRSLHNAVQSAKVAYYEANPIGTEDTD